MQFKTGLKRINKNANHTEVSKQQTITIIDLFLGMSFARTIIIIIQVLGFNVNRINKNTNHTEVSKQQTISIIGLVLGMSFARTIIIIIQILGFSVKKNMFCDALLTQ
jgi:predicted ABC-type sugar transport system permease subunit